MLKKMIDGRKKAQLLHVNFVFCSIHGYINECSSVTEKLSAGDFLKISLASVGEL